MDACRTAIEAAYRRLGQRVTFVCPGQRFFAASLGARRPSGRQWMLSGLCCWLMVSVANTISAEEPLRKAVTAGKPAVEVNDAVLNYQNLGQFQGQVYVTKNFRVRAANSQLAQAVGDRAEGYRELLAMQWLGQTLPVWPQPCPIEVTVSHQAQGETSFMLSDDGTAPPTDWEMKVFGPTDRLLDSVLPHEVTHTIFATYFRKRLPRWADEGACTTIEHASEREKIHALLLRYLSPEQRQGIPFNRMFPMRDYPADMLPLYAQGYSVAKFLIAQGGHRQFVQLVERGLQHESRMPVTVAWDQAMRETYGYQDLSDLQLDWLKWVSEGSQDSAAVARMEQRSGIRLAGLQTPDTEVAPAVAPNAALANFNSPNAVGATDDNFYVQQMRTGLANPVTPAVEPVGSESFSKLVTASEPPPSQSNSLTSPAPVGQPTYRSDSTILLPKRLR